MLPKIRLLILTLACATVFSQVPFLFLLCPQILVEPSTMRPESLVRTGPTAICFDYGCHHVDNPETCLDYLDLS